MLRKTRYLDSLAHKPVESLLVTAADKAHNAGDMVLDARKNHDMWSKFNAGLDGSAWYLMRMHQQLSQQLPTSRSVQRLGEAVGEILNSTEYQLLVPDNMVAESWAHQYPQRHTE